jgi:hypothetical protein
VRWLVRWEVRRLIAPLPAEDGRTPPQAGDGVAGTGALVVRSGALRVRRLVRCRAWIEKTT